MKKKLLRHTGYPKNKIILLIITAVLLTVVITSFIYNIISIFDVQKYDYHITVAQKGEVGLDIGTDALYFGKIPKGSSGQRYVNITNSHTKPLRVFITFSGDGSDWITPEDNTFILNPNQTKTITITANIPEDAQLGDYKGTMSAFFKKV